MTTVPFGGKLAVKHRMNSTVAGVELHRIVAVVFIMLVIGIRTGDRPGHLSDAPGTVLDALTRKFLGLGVHRSHYEDN